MKGEMYLPVGCSRHGRVGAGSGGDFDDLPGTLSQSLPVYIQELILLHADSPFGFLKYKISEDILKHMHIQIDCKIK